MTDYRKAADTDFRQTIPGFGKWTLVGKFNKSAGVLKYADEDGQTITVPNIWYNQPVEVRIEFYRVQAHEARQRATHLIAEHRHGPSATTPWAEAAIQGALTTAERCDAIANEMERTRKVIG